MGLIHKLFCKHKFIPYADGSLNFCMKCGKTRKISIESKLEYYIILGIAIASFVTIFALFFMYGCESYQIKKCWHCEVTTIYTDENYPHLVSVKGQFIFCDSITPEEMKEFEQGNTYSDSTMIQTCKCEYK